MNGEELLTPKEAASILKVSPITIRSWLRSGRLKGVKVSNMWRVRRSDLDELLFYAHCSKEEGK